MELFPLPVAEPLLRPRFLMSKVNKGATLKRKYSPHLKIGNRPAAAMSLRSRASEPPASHSVCRKPPL
ncbi:hypothetical protein E2C01_055986 [Portunus trituberculatus]|uniref:Uncharacterized protein n=1 Tax=Portunus trituberculatus TaxID=210409 RepID=A0A5B7GWN6_PORTR|nr:hypothetical protein [Portunus trituberculatus]